MGRLPAGEPEVASPDARDGRVRLDLRPFWGHVNEYAVLVSGLVGRSAVSLALTGLRRRRVLTRNSRRPAASRGRAGATRRRRRGSHSWSARSRCCDGSLLIPPVKVFEVSHPSKLL